VQITATNAPARLVAQDSQEALEAYGWLRELAGALAARLLDVRTMSASDLATWHGYSLAEIYGLNRRPG
jgi:hypothetical protein